MSYAHLSPFERCDVESLHRAGQSVRSIAKELGRSPSTISRELKRNTMARGRYRALHGQEAYHERRTRSVKPQTLTMNTQLRTYVEEKLAEKWSPEP